MTLAKQLYVCYADGIENSNEERNQSSRKKVGAPLVRKLQEKSVRNLRGNKKCEDNYTTKEEIEEILDEGTTRSSSALPVSGFAFESIYSSCCAITWSFLCRPPPAAAKQLYMCYAEDFVSNDISQATICVLRWRQWH